jgi:hypothetical protein
MLEVRAQDASAEFAYIGHDERGTKLCPGDELSRLRVIDHPVSKKEKKKRTRLG